MIVLLSDGANKQRLQRAHRRRGPSEATRRENLYNRPWRQRPSSGGDDPDAVDFAALQKLAEIADGAAFRARTTDELDAAARAIEGLAAGETLAPPTIIYADLWPYPAALAFVAALALAFARRTPR